MTTGAALLSSFIGGAIVGGIGAGVSRNSASPILTGALITGFINAAAGAIILAVSPSARQQVTSNSSGTVSGLQKEWGMR